MLVASPLGSRRGEPLRVGDLGAGNQRLLPALEGKLASFDYHAYDLHPQSKDVRWIDVEREMPSRDFDVVFCLGLLEYLRDLDRFVSRLHTICSHAIVSYVMSDPPDSLTPAERRERGWLNDLTQTGLEEIFGRHAYRREAFVLTNAGRTGLWLWATAEDAANPRT
jgi:hypothetical protein